MEVGDKYISKAFGHEATVIEKLPYPFVKVQFDLTGKEKTLRRSNLRSLEFKDDNQPTLHGVGIVGGVTVRVDGSLLPSYVAWSSMLGRCYSVMTGASVCEDWLYFPNFKEWFDENVPEGWCVDKDFKVRGNLLYSADTCTPLPTELNALLVRCDGLKCYTLTRNLKYDVRVRAEGSTTIRKCFNTEKEAVLFYFYEKGKYIDRLRENYKGNVPDYVFDNAQCFLKEEKTKRLAENR